MNYRELFYLRSGADAFCDTIKLFLSTVSAIILGFNIKWVLDIFFMIVSKIGDNQIIILAGGVVIAVFCEFIIDTIPEYFVDILYDKLDSIGFEKRFNVLNDIKTFLILMVIKAVNYMFIGLLISFVFLSVLKYGEDDNAFYSTSITYKISNHMVNEMINSDYMQYFIRKNEVYNGVNMNEAMKIDREIEKEAKEVVKDSKSDLEKAKRIYNWVGTNIIYDEELADDIGNKKIEETFGAKYAFYNRSGICFDFATLFGAMAASVDLRVNVVIGNAFNGIEFGPHAWNEVYLEDEDRWIKVDSTFWGHKGSFDSSYFDIIHEKEKIAWEN